MKKIAIFDLDGTLFDTTAAMQACGNFALEKLGMKGFTRQDYALFSGGGIEGYVNAILDAAGDKEHKNFDEFWRLYLEKNATLGMDANVPYEGIPELLSALKKKGVCLAVLSNKDHASCVSIVEKTFGKDAFHIIRGDMGTIPVKPDPAGVYAVLEQAGFTAKEALYIGDTQVDTETGRNAGVEVAAVLWGYRTREILEKEDPDYLVSSPNELLPFFA